MRCFRETLDELASLPGSQLTAISRAYRTEALMADTAEPPGPDYWNAAVGLATDLSPDALLTRLHTIEANAGRVRRARWEARPLDLDLLFYDDLVLETSGLSLPHPHVASRLFVVAPLADIAPQRQIGGLDMVQRLATFDLADLLEIRGNWAARTAS